MATANLYLNFPGNTEEAFQYYQSIFGGEFEELKRFSDTPFGANLPEADQTKMMHIRYALGNIRLMGTDVLSSQSQSLIIGTNFSICVDAKDKAEADVFYSKLSANGKAEMPMQDQFWGGYFGMCTDKFNVQWMVQWVGNC
jgi:PhnB protein